MAIEVNGRVPAWSINEKTPDVPGRETLVSVEARPRMVMPSAPGRKTLVGDDAASSRLSFDDYRVLGLKELLQRLGPGHALRQDIVAAAASTNRSIVLHVGKDDFVVSFELLPKAGAGGDVRVVVSPTDLSRARQSLMKYWDVRGREVNKDDSWTSMGNVGTDAAPWVQQVPIADRTTFDPVILKELPEKAATVWTFDWNRDTKPEFAIRIDFWISSTQRDYNFTAGPPGTTSKFDFSFIQADAWKYGYQGAVAPRREQDDFVDFLGGILTSKTTWEMAITMIPVIGQAPAHDARTVRCQPVRLSPQESNQGRSRCSSRRRHRSVNGLRVGVP